MSSYRDNRYPREAPSGPRNDDGYRSTSSYASYPPPPPPSHAPPPQPPPPPARRWDDHDREYRPNDRDQYNPRKGRRYEDRRDDREYQGGGFSGLRQNGDSGDYYRRGGGGRDDPRPPQGDFSFRASAPNQPDFQSAADSYVPSHRQSRDRIHRRGGRDQHSRFDRGGRGGRGGGRGRPWQFGSRKAADRAFLTQKHDGEGQLLLGNNTTGRPTFRDVENLTDSDEAEMDISGDSDNADEPSSKRARTSAHQSTQQQQDAPKWSNPDPYTALPPPPDESRKKMDMVQLIRKARLEAGPKDTTLPSGGDDFISCDLSDDDKDNKDKGPGDRGTIPRGVTREDKLSNPLPPVPPPANSQHSLIQNAPASLPPRPTPSTFNPTAPLPTQGPHAVGNKKVDLTPSTSLGNRKRTYDDRIKLPHSSLKKAPKMRADGYIVPDWRPHKDEDPCPWETTDHSASRNMGTRLHKEIMDFYNFVRPRDFEEDIRNQMVAKLETVIKQKFRDAHILPFGSFMNGLYLPTADMDIAVCSDNLVRHNRPIYNKSTIFGMRSHLQRKNVPYQGEVELILHAKVPLIKYTDNTTALKVDVSFEKIDGYRAIQTFKAWKEQYPAMPILVAFIKQFLAMRGLNEPVNGGIGGFSVICLVVNLLNQIPEVQCRSMVPEHHLGQLLMEFFEFYGNQFQYETVAIRMNPPGLVNKSSVSKVTYRNMDRLSILDPNNPENDIAGGSANTFTIISTFSEAAAYLRDKMAELSKPGATGTLLGPLMGGRYSKFVCQRDYLERLHSLGPLPEYSGRPPRLEPDWR